MHVSAISTYRRLGIVPLAGWNVDRDLFRRLVVPGVFGGVVGGFFLAWVSGEAIIPWVSAYLVLAGFIVLFKAVRDERKNYTEPRRGLPAPLGLTGGFLDAVGGGGWGPVMTSTLLSRGTAPRW